MDLELACCLLLCTVTRAPSSLSYSRFFLMSDNLQMIKPMERLGLPQYVIYLFITSSVALDTPLAAHPVRARFLMYSLMLLSVSLPSWPLFLWWASYCSFPCVSMLGSFLKLHLLISCTFLHPSQCHAWYGFVILHSLIFPRASVASTNLHHKLTLSFWSMGLHLMKIFIKYNLQSLIHSSALSECRKEFPSMHSA